MDDDVECARELDGAHLQHAGAGAGKLQHVLIGDLVELLGARADARIGGVDAVDVGVDLAHVGSDAPGHRDRRGVGAAAAERGDVAGGVDALEAGDHGDVAAREGVHDALVVDLHDLGLGVGAVGLDARLASGEAHRLVAARLDGHGEKRHGHLLARGQEAVHLARGRIAVERRGKADELVGGFAHGGHDGDHLVPLRDLLDALGRSHRRAAEFAYDQRHIVLSFRR